MKRLGQPKEIAKAVAFLAIDATYTTGIELPVRWRMVSPLSYRPSWKISCGSELPCVKMNKCMRRKS